MGDKDSTVPVVITGIGMYTPVGATAAQTTTSVLAGLDRFRVWPYLGLDVADGVDGLPVASSIAGFSDLSWVEKSEDLATPPLREALFDAALYSSADLISAYGREAISAYIALPYPGRDGVNQESVRAFMQDAAEHCIVDLHAFRVEFEACGHAGGLRGLVSALRDLGENETDVCVVGGIDSLLETRYLSACIAQERIKLESTADGLIPGEGASFLVLERREDAIRRGASVRGLIGNIALADEPIAYSGQDPLEAGGLTSAIQAVLENCDPASPAISDVFIDVNGERGRFQEWALAEGRCLHRLPYGWRLHRPASSLGDLGAATGTTQVGLAAGMFGLHRARGDAALVCASSEKGERACVLVGGPELDVQ